MVTFLASKLASKKNTNIFMDNIRLNNNTKMIKNVFSWKFQINYWILLEYSKKLLLKIKTKNLLIKKI